MQQAYNTALYSSIMFPGPKTTDVVVQVVGQIHILTADYFSFSKQAVIKNNYSTILENHCLRRLIAERCGDMKTHGDQDC